MSRSAAGTDEIKLIEAEGFYNQALRESIQKHGVSHIKVAAPLRSLGRLKAKRKELEMARELFERALEILEDHNGKDNVALCALLNDLSKCQYGAHARARLDLFCGWSVLGCVFGRFVNGLGSLGGSFVCFFEAIPEVVRRSGNVVNGGPSVCLVRISDWIRAVKFWILKSHTIQDEPG